MTAIAENLVEFDPRPPEFSDIALADRFADRHAGDLRYVDAWGRWLRYDGRRWGQDQTRHAFDLARAVCQEAASECNEKRAALKIASATTIAAVAKVAMADRRIAAISEQWDADPWLLNTPGGVVDLRDSQMRPHDADDYMTKITVAAPDATEAPLWLGFLERITAGDRQLQDFLRRLCGYALTGETREHALAFLYGTGANGKSVFIETINGIMGDYATNAPVETFTASKSDRHPTDLAMLRGARLVTAVETEEGRRWAEAKIKQLTGGDAISARFMRQDFFTYKPQFTLIVCGNHKPGLRSVDEAIRRRLHLVPFSVTIPEDERDDQLPEKLKAEWPAILSWMIEGAVEWGMEGLRPPESVIAATEDYLASEDVFAAWLDERCEEAGRESTSMLYHDWREFASNAGEEAGTQKRFAEKLKDRGFEQYRTKEARGFIGIRLLPKGQPGDYG